MISPSCGISASVSRDVSGHVVELADCDEVFDNRSTLHACLLAAVPVPDPTVEADRSFQPLPGEVPSPINPPSGCVFHPRCPIAVAECQRARPELRECGRATGSPAARLYKGSDQETLRKERA